MKGELFLKTIATSDITGNNNGWVDAYETWGVSLEENALSRLMTPAPNKQPVENKSELEHGKRIIRDSLVMKEERNVSLIMNISAPNQSEFLTRYGNFCTQVLDKGYIELRTKYQGDNVIYRMTFVDCTQFQEYCLGVGKYTLSLNEPNPADRGVNPA